MEKDDYVYPGQRFTENGFCTGHGQGMTLRDWFAGQAGKNDISLYREPYAEYTKVIKRFLFWTWETEELVGILYKYTHEQARYRYADAMLEARKK